MFVSKKNLSLIHVVSAEVAARIDVAHLLHQRIETLGVSRTLSELCQPFTECRIQSPALGMCNRARSLDQVFVRT